MNRLVHLLSDRSLQAVHHPNQNYFPLPRRPQPPPTKRQANLPQPRGVPFRYRKISARSISSQDHGKSAPSPCVGPLSFFCADAANRSKLSQTTPFLSQSVIFFVTLPELVLEDLVLATQFLPPSEHVTPTSLDHHFPKKGRRYESPSFAEGENHLKGRPKAVCSTWPAHLGLLCSLDREKFVPKFTPRFTQYTIVSFDQALRLPVMLASIPNSSHSRANVVPHSPP